MLCASGWSPPRCHAGASEGRAMTGPSLTEMEHVASTFGVGMEQVRLSTT
jgi:hypothetical protein